MPSGLKPIWPSNASAPTITSSVSSCQKSVILIASDMLTEIDGDDRVDGRIPLCSQFLSAFGQPLLTDSVGGDIDGDADGFGIPVPGQQDLSLQHRLACCRRLSRRDSLSEESGTAVT